MKLCLPIVRSRLRVFAKGRLARLVVVQRRPCDGSIDDTMEGRPWQQTRLLQWKKENGETYLLIRVVMLCILLVAMVDIVWDREARSSRSDPVEWVSGS